VKSILAKPSIIQFKSFGLMFIFFFSSYFAAAQKDMYYLYIGTYTQKGSKGIYLYQFNSVTGAFKPIAVTEGISNPSFLAISSDQQFLYAVAGKGSDSVRAYSIDKKSHQLSVLNTQSLAGSNGACHLEVDKTGRWLIVGNYGSGSVSVLSIEKNGKLGNVTQTITHEGKSIDPDRQQKPHVHSVNFSPNSKYVFVPDLGTDKIMTYQLNAQTGNLMAGDVPFTSVTPGTGPRHFTFHPNGKFAYVIQEMSASITAFKYNDGTLETIQRVTNLPDTYTGRKWAADIHLSPDGKFLYGSTRAHDSLVIFKVDEKTGLLTLVGLQSVNGKTPRNFAIDPTGNFVLVANQDSDNITIFKRDKVTGKLTFTNTEINVSMPVCLKFVP
jgi:6-phosphogluconolactonase